MALIITSNTLNEEKPPDLEVKDDSSQAGLIKEKQKEMDHKVQTFKKSVQQIEQDIQVLQNIQDEDDLQKTPPSQEAETKQVETAIRQMPDEMHEKRSVVIKEIATVLTQAEQIQHKLISYELPEWKHRQQMACIGGPPNACLDQLQNWFTTVAECLQQIRLQLKKVQKSTYDPLTVGKSQLDEKALSLFKNLLSHSLVVERQPCMPTHPQRPLVIKVHVQFTVKIRLLVKLQELTGQPRVQASVHKGLTERDTVERFRTFLLLTGMNKCMNIEEPGGCLTANLCMMLKERKTTRNSSFETSLSRPQITLYEELHLLNFDTQLILPDICIDLSITSLPFVVINPYCNMFSAWASILWYNTLSSEPQNRTFFFNPPPVKWAQLSKVLNWQFSSVTKRVLTSEQLMILADKFLGPEAQGDPEGLIHWNTFFKTYNQEHGGSVWQWIYGNLHLVSGYLLNIWNDGYIMGFLSKEQEKSLLRDKPSGTFLLRFSETCRDGGITITWVEHSQDGVLGTLVDVIRDYSPTISEKGPVNPLIYLYPDIPRDVAFGCYYTGSSEVQAGGSKEGYGSYVPVCKLLDKCKLNPEDLREGK